MFCLVVGTFFVVMDVFVRRRVVKVLFEVRVYADGGVGGGVGVGFWGFGEVVGYGVLVNVGLAGGEVGGALDEVVGVAALPDGEFGGEAVGEAALDEVHDVGEGFVAWGEDEMDVVGHEDVGVESVVRAIVVEGF